MLVSTANLHLYSAGGIQQEVGTEVQAPPRLESSTSPRFQKFNLKMVNLLFQLEPGSPSSLRHYAEALDRKRAKEDWADNQSELLEKLQECEVGMRNRL